MKRLATLCLRSITRRCRARRISSDTQGGERSRHAQLAAPTGRSQASALPDAQGNWTGLDVDFCRAIAAAVLQRRQPRSNSCALPAKDRFTALQSGEVDVLARNTT